MVFTLTSPAFGNGAVMPQAQVYSGMGQTGGNLSPPLQWEGAPAETKSFVVTLYDPDAPTGSGWWHWVVANIPADVTSLVEGAGSGQGGFRKARSKCGPILVSRAMVEQRLLRDTCTVMCLPSRLWMFRFWM